MYPYSQQGLMDRNICSEDSVFDLNQDLLVEQGALICIRNVL
jgi:hypothetical protein